MTEQRNPAWDMLVRHRWLEHAYHREFEQIFGVSLMRYWDMVTGFDLVKFDAEVLQTPDHIGARDICIRKFGKRAADVIVYLIGGTPEGVRGEYYE